MEKCGNIAWWRCYYGNGGECSGKCYSGSMVSVRGGVCHTSRASAPQRGEHMGDRRNPGNAGGDVVWCGVWFHLRVAALI